MRATMFNWDSKRVSRRFKKFPRMAIINFMGVQSLVQLDNDYTDERLDDILIDTDMENKQLLFCHAGYTRGIPMFLLSRDLHRKIVDSLGE